MKSSIFSRRRRPLLGFLLGLCAVFVWGCTLASAPQVDSLEDARTALNDYILPKIDVATETIPDEAAARYATDQFEEPLPNVADYPLYGAQPGGSNTVYLEIFSSSEKANIERQNERWLVEVAEAFNQRQETLPSGEVIQVGIRQIASGTAARVLGAGVAQPQGYSPSNDLWVSMIQSQGVDTVSVVDRLVPNTAGWVDRKSVV